MLMLQFLGPRITDVLWAGFIPDEIGMGCGHVYQP